MEARVGPHGIEQNVHNERGIASGMGLSTLQFHRSAGQKGYKEPSQARRTLNKPKATSENTLNSNMALNNVQTMTQFAGNGAWMGNEPIVNGMWNDLLRRYFPANDGTILIAPELYPEGTTDSKKAADLGVLRVDTDESTFTPLLIYEGKKSDGDSFPNILVQLTTWVSYQTMAHNKCCWFVGAKGGKVRLWVYQRIGQGKEGSTRSCQVSANGTCSNGPLNGLDDGYIFDLTNNPNDRPLLDGILTWMVGPGLGSNTFVH